MDLPTPLRLFDQPRAPNPMRLAAVLAEKGLDIPRVEVDLMSGAHRDAEFLARVGVAQVPALELSDGRVLTEVPAICRYLEALHPEPALLGRGPLEAAEVEMWQRRIEFGLYAAVVQTFRHTNPKMAVLETQCADWGELNRGRIDGHLAALDARLSGRDWIAGVRLSLADITAYIAVKFRRIIKHPMPDGLDALAAWIDRVAARPAAQPLERR